MVESGVDNKVYERYAFASRLFGRDLWMSIEGSERLYTTLAATFNFRFPRHFFFANFRCLRCGRCCKYYVPPIKVYTVEIKRWIGQGEKHILEHIWCFKKEGYCAKRISNSVCVDCDSNAKQIESESASRKGCPFLRRVRNKPYYKCSIRDTVPETCSGYLCQKSLSVAHLKWKNVDELIAKLGLPAYRKLKVA